MSRFDSHGRDAFERAVSCYIRAVGVPKSEEAIPHFERSALGPDEIWHLRNRYANPLAVVMPNGQVYDRPGGHLLGPAP